MKKGVLLIVLFLFLSVSLVSAVQVSYDAVQSEVLPGQSAVFTVHMKNTDTYNAVTVTMNSIDLSWTLDKDHQNIMLNHGQTQDVVVQYTPTVPNNKPGSYGVNFQVTTPQERQIQLLPIIVVDYKDVLDVSLPALPLDPRHPAILQLAIKNKYAIALQNVKVALQGQLFNVEQFTDIGPHAEKVLEFPVKLQENQQEGDYDVHAIVTMGAQSFVDQVIKVTVSKYGAVQEVVSPEQSLFTVGETVTHTNRGNTVVTDQYAKHFSTVAYKFTMFSPMPSNVVSAANGYDVQWSTTLQPGASVTIQYSTNFGKPLLYAILLLVVLVFLYQWRKKNLTVRKKVMVLHTEKGGVAIMKVLIAVKNTSGRELMGVSVMDKVPKVITAPNDFGTHKPEQVKQMPDGIMIMWKVQHMKRNEEVLFSYKISSKMHLLGRIQLPRAVAKSMTGTKKYIGRSPSVTLRERK